MKTSREQDEQCDEYNFPPVNRPEAHELVARGVDWKFIETCVKYPIETQKKFLAARVRDVVRLFADEELDKYMEAEADRCEQRMEEVRKIQARYEEETKTYPERLTVIHGSLGTIRKEVADLKREIDTALDPEGAAVRREEPNLEAGPKEEARARADARADRLKIHPIAAQAQERAIVRNGG
jgi:hypothetical protein